MSASVTGTLPGPADRVTNELTAQARAGAIAGRKVSIRQGGHIGIEFGEWLADPFGVRDLLVGRRIAATGVGHLLDVSTIERLMQSSPVARRRSLPAYWVGSARLAKRW